MNAARDEVLRRIRRSLADVPSGERPHDVAVPRAYRRRDDLGHADLVERFAETVDDYRATVRRVAVADLAQPRSARSARSAACVGSSFRLPCPPSGVRRDVDLVEDRDLSAAELDRLDGALTGCAAAIAQTGTLVLDGRTVSGRRAITLVPDHHICIVLPHQIVGLVPEAIARLGDAVRSERRPITLISGPSATSDIELTRVEGVHGPRNLLVVIAE